MRCAFSVIEQNTKASSGTSTVDRAIVDKAASEVFEPPAAKPRGVARAVTALAVLSVGGTYYLPYQPHATPAQFSRAYRRSGEFFALKRRLDPGDKFRNNLWDHYDPAGPLRRTT